MPTSLNALLTAWAVTIILIFGGVVAVQLSYDPADFDGAKPAATAGHGGETATKPADTHGAGDQIAEDEDHGAAPSAADADMPAPGQATDAQEPMSAAAQLPHLLPVMADPSLLEETDKGMLPKVAEDGRRPFDVYSRGLTIAPKMPRIAIIVTELGQRMQTTRRAIADLPPSITLAFSPYAGDLINWGERAREAGHEVLLMVPMEPVNYPQNDPGPFTLLTENTSQQNIGLLEDSLGRLTGYVGIIDHMGSRFTAAPDALSPVLSEVKRRGLMFVDSRSSQYSQASAMSSGLGIPTAYNNRTIDDDLASDAIAKQLADLENRARSLGAAVGLARPFPVSFDAIKLWAAGLRSRGIQLVPISALAGKQPPAN